MSTALRSLLSVAIVAAMTLSFLPSAQSGLPGTGAACCAMMKWQSLGSSDACQHQMPDSAPDQRCCSWCPFFVAVLASGARPFVYGACGEYLFPPVSDRAYLRGDEPPVPPPRVVAA